MEPTLADRVKEARRAAGMSQTEAATAAGVSLSALRNIEQGITTDPRVSTLESILSALAEAASLHGAPSTTSGNGHGRRATDVPAGKAPGTSKARPLAGQR
jgi:transcriptional regulator with XRE-family HTH domain